MISNFLFLWNLRNKQWLCKLRSIWWKITVLSRQLEIKMCNSPFSTNALQCWFCWLSNISLVLMSADCISKFEGELTKNQGVNMMTINFMGFLCKLPLLKKSPTFQIFHSSKNECSRIAKSKKWLINGSKTHYDQWDPLRQ